MKKKLFIWIVSIFGVIVLAGGTFTYYMYTHVSQVLQDVNKPLSRKFSSVREKKVTPAEKKPISILLLGSDPRGDERGRSDSLLLLTLNPTKQSMKMLSIPRDSYVEIIGRGTRDKINHAYSFGGIDMSVNTVEKFLNVPVDYYVEVNMEGFKEIVNVVNGVDVNNDVAFTVGDTTFPVGPLHLNGEKTLQYTRARYEDPRGDFARQLRQRQVIQAVIRKGANVSTLTNYIDVLRTIQKYVKTNVTQDEIIALQKNYRQTRNQVEELQLAGEGKIQNSIWYYMVNEQSRQDVSQKLREHLELN